MRKHEKLFRETKALSLAPHQIDQDAHTRAARIADQRVSQTSLDAQIGLCAIQSDVNAPLRHLAHGVEQNHGVLFQHRIPETIDLLVGQ